MAINAKRKIYYIICAVLGVVLLAGTILLVKNFFEARAYYLEMYDMNNESMFLNAANSNLTLVCVWSTLSICAYLAIVLNVKSLLKEFNHTFCAIFSIVSVSAVLFALIFGHLLINTTQAYVITDIACVLIDLAAIVLFIVFNIVNRKRKKDVANTEKQDDDTVVIHLS